jgi:hypothetical protein
VTRLSLQVALVVLVAAATPALDAQQIQSTFADLTVPGHWQEAKQFAGAHFGTDIFYDSTTGAVLQIRQQGGMEKVGEIAKYFGGLQTATREAAGVMSAAEFPLPLAYTERASKDLVKGNKPPKLWDVKEGEGNPMWFYASQLFDDYRMREIGGGSEVHEEYLPVHVSKAEQRAVTGGDVLLFEVETDRPASEVALKRFHMPAGLKDQRVRYGWVQFAPGGIASGQGVLSAAFATAANSSLTIDDVAKQLAEAKIKPL